jgi:hypothetical protein
MSIFVNPQMLPKIRSEKLLAEVRKMPCSLRIGTFVGKSCTGKTQAVHLDKAGGKGMSTKVSDLAVVAGCDVCHRILDWRDLKSAEEIADKYGAALAWQVVRALRETQARLVEVGHLTGPDWEII